MIRKGLNLVFNSALCYSYLVNLMNPFVKKIYLPIYSACMDANNKLA